MRRGGFTPLEILFGKKDRAKSLTGFTLVEVIVSALILAATIAGLFATFVAVRKYNLRSRVRLNAANYARELLDELKDEVKQSTWDSGPLSVQGWTPWEDVETVAGEFAQIYQIQRRYRVDAVPTKDYRKVTVEVKWNVPQ